MIIKFSKKFTKAYKKTPVKIQNQFKARLKLFMENPLNPILRVHKLKGILSEYYSMDITGDWRALYKIENNEKYKFMKIGTHSQLY